MPRPKPVYDAPAEVLVVLINESIYGPPERRLAAKFILDCLRRYRTPDEVAGCLHELEAQALLDIAKEARKLASALDLIA